MSGAFHDHFSENAVQYAAARPSYPPELFAFIANLVPGHRLAWDVGTGNGQAALGLARHFDRVIAADASREQLKHATRHPKIEYRVATAESVGIEPNSVDLVAVAQALHWFNFEQFYAQVRLAAVPEGVLAAWCYGIHTVEPGIDAVVRRFYDEVTGPYWPSERRYVDDRYETIPFPFINCQSRGRPNSLPRFECREHWNLSQFLAYLGTWSAVQQFRKQLGRDPLDEIVDELLSAWGDPRQRRIVTWPIHLRTGRVLS